MKKWKHNSSNTHNPFAGYDGNNADARQEALSNLLIDPNADTFLGMKVPAGALAAAEPLIAIGTAKLARHGSTFIRDHVTDVLTRTEWVDKGRAQTIGKIAGAAFNWGVPLAKSLGEIAQTSGGYFKALFALRRQISPVIAATQDNKTGLNALFATSNKNELYTYARKQIHSETMRNFSNNVLDLVTNAPALATAYYNSEMMKLEERQKKFYNKRYEQELATADGQYKGFTKSQLANDSSFTDKLRGEFKSKLHDEKYKIPGIGGTPSIKKLKNQIEGIEMWGTSAAKLAKVLVVHNFMGKQVDPAKSALSLILELDAYMAERAQHGGGTKHSKSTESHVRLAVGDIFRQHQVNMGRHEISERFGEEFGQVVDSISHRIAAGELSVRALDILVGEGKIVQAKGNKITGVMPIEEVDNMLDHLTDILAPSIHTDPAEFYSEASFSKGDLEAMFKHTQGTERALLITLFSEHPNILQSVGVKRADIRTARNEVESELYSTLQNLIIDLSKQDEKVLRDTHHLSLKEIREIKDFAEELEHSGARMMENALKGDQREMWKAIMRNAVVSAGIEEGRELIAQAFERAGETERESSRPARSEKRPSRRSEREAREEVVEPANVSEKDEEDDLPRYTRAERNRRDTRQEDMDLPDF